MALFTRVVKNEEEYNLPRGPVNQPAVEEVVMAEAPAPAVADRDWLDRGETDGQLSVDVYQTEDNIVVKSTIAGVKPEDIDIAIDNDMVTIRGTRQHEENIKEEDFFYQECYWGDFSRSVVLPVEIKAEEAEAILKNGVLTLILPKAHKAKSFAVKVKGE
jgi:HSP20 family protein